MLACDGSSAHRVATMLGTSLSSPIPNNDCKTPLVAKQLSEIHCTLRASSLHSCVPNLYNRVLRLIYGARFFHCVKRERENPHMTVFSLTWYRTGSTKCIFIHSHTEYTFSHKSTLILHNHFQNLLTVTI